MTLVEQVKHWLLRTTARWRHHHPWPMPPERDDDQVDGMTSQYVSVDELGRLVCLRCGQGVLYVQGNSTIFDWSSMYDWFQHLTGSRRRYEPMTGCRGYREDEVVPPPKTDTPLPVRGLDAIDESLGLK